MRASPRPQLPRWEQAGVVKAPSEQGALGLEAGVALPACSLGVGLAVRLSFPELQFLIGQPRVPPPARHVPAGHSFPSQG